MSSLKEVAQYVRSKAAGPFWVTIDIFCPDRASFDRVRQARSLSPSAIATLYGVSANSVRAFEVPSLLVMKISFPRREPQGSVRDSDSHAGQFFVPLLDVSVD